MNQFLGYALLSLGTGALYAFVATGVLLVQRGSGVLNFAQGALLALSAFVFDHAKGEWGWTTGLAATFAVSTTAFVGLAFHLLVMRPMRRAAPINRVMATLGLLIIVSEFISLGFGDATRSAPSLLPQGSVTLFDTVIGQHVFWRAGIVGLVAGGLWAFFRFTPPGLATSAVAENAEAAATLGWSPDMVAGLSWFVGGAIAGLGGVLLSPFQLNSSNLVLLIVPGLAVALIGSFRHFPLVLVGAFLVAFAELEVQVQIIQDDPQGYRGLDKIVPLVVIIVFLVVRGRSIPERGFVSEERPELGTGRINLPLLGVGVAVVLALVWGAMPVTWVNAVATNATYALIILSLVVVVGFTGQLSLGQFAFAGVGALVTGRLMATQDWPFGPALLVGVAVAVPVGLLFALPALRTRGLQLAVVTLSMAVAVNEVLFQRAYFSPIPPGTVKSTLYSDVIAKPSGTIVANNQMKGPLSFFGIQVDQSAHPQRYATFCLVLFVVVAVLVANLRRSRAGRRLIAVRTNERAAAALGVNNRGAKLFAFGLSAAIAALGGILLAFTSSNVTFDSSFVPLQSIVFIAFAVVGGIGYVSGSFAGALLGPQSLGTRVGAWVSDRLAGAAGVLKFAFVTFAALFGFRVGRGMRQTWQDERARLMPGCGVLVFAVIGVLLSGNAQDWLSHLDRYLPILGGFLLLQILVTSGGSGLAGGAAAVVRPLVERITPSRDVARTAAMLEGVEDTGRVHVRSSELEVRGVTVRFGAVVAVDDVSFRVRSGEVLGLIGPNGAGKTTMVDAITGYNKPSSGSIVLDGTPLDMQRPHLRARAGLSRSFQNLELFEDLTVLENIRAASDDRDAKAFITGLFSWRNPPLSATAVAAIREFGLEGDLETPVKDLPYGRRRLVAIARAIAASPSILLLDEPAAGLDEAESAELARLTRRLSTEWGLGILLIEHDMTFVMEVCDRITVLDFGRSIAEGTPAEIQLDPAVLVAYLGAEGEATAPPSADSPKTKASR